jgi:hypothetical protein
MAAAPEPQESLRERARRALLDNPDPASLPPAPPAPPARVAAAGLGAGNEPGGTSDPAIHPGDQIQERLSAIRLVRELEPKRACYADRVRDLSRTLTQLSGDSVHYGAVVDKLREAHAEWLQLEERLWAAHYIIRSTQWLVDLLTDPAEGKEAGHER